MGGGRRFPVRSLPWTLAVSRVDSRGVSRGVLRGGVRGGFQGGPRNSQISPGGDVLDAAQQKLKILRMEYMRMSSGPNMFPVCHGKSRPFSTARNETAWTYSMPRSLHLGHGECLNIRNVTLQVLRFGFPVLACFRFPDAIFSA